MENLKDRQQISIKNIPLKDLRKFRAINAVRGISVSRAVREYIIKIGATYPDKAK